MKKQSPKAKFIAEVDLKRLAGCAWDAMILASTHDPDHDIRLSILERQMERFGAPQYRVLRKGKMKKRVK